MNIIVITLIVTATLFVGSLIITTYADTHPDSILDNRLIVGGKIVFTSTITCIWALFLMITYGDNMFAKYALLFFIAAIITTVFCRKWYKQINY